MTCTKCGGEKVQKVWSGRTRWVCEPCKRAYTREWRLANPDRTKAMNQSFYLNNRDRQRALRRERYYQDHEATLEKARALNKPEAARKRRREGAQRRKHGATLAELLATQGGRCAICGTADPGDQGWHVDHDHDVCPQIGHSCTLCQRSVTCQNCNLLLGHARDNPATLRRAADYLEGFQQIKAHHDEYAVHELSRGR